MTSATPVTTAQQRDAAAMVAIAAGDDAAFGRVHREHYAAVFRLALSTVLDPEEARDVAQEVFVRLHARAPGWEPRAQLRTWLHRTTLNVSMSMRRRLRRWLRPRGGEVDADDPEASVIADDAYDDVRRQLARLSPRQRAVVSLHLDAELTPKEIAAHLGITANAARVTLHKGLTRLRTAYQGADTGTLDQEAS